MGAKVRYLTILSIHPLILTTRLTESPDAAEVVRSFKERHYRDWADEALPALNGQTPRQAMGSAAGRQRVDVLLKDMENMERRWPEAGRYDFSQLRRALGFEA